MCEESEVTVTVRLIRSFTHRNIFHVVYKDVDLSQTAEAFRTFVLSDLPKRANISPPFRKFTFDTMKIEHQPHMSKTSDPVINTADDDKLMLNLSKSLHENGIINETEISCFKLKEYKEYQQNPQTEFR